MPELGQIVILLVVLLAAGLVVAGPILWPARIGGDGLAGEEDAAGLALRHRIAVESLHDVEADRRAGSLDPEGYEAARAEAEERAARTLAALEAALAQAPDAPSAPRATTFSRRAAGLVGAGIVALILFGSFLPAPLTLANGTVTGRARVTAMEKALSDTSTVAGVNGDLFNFKDGHPTGIVMDNNVIKSPPYRERSSVGISSTGTLSVSNATYSGDTKPGDTHGQGVGGVWFALSNSGSSVGAGAAPAATTIPTTTKTTAGGTGGGY